MIFTPLPLAGAYLIRPEHREDERGFFTRTFCQHEFAQHGLHTQIAQTNVSHNKHTNTLRGMHYQRAPHAEAKLVSCTVGAIYDVIIDLRPSSPTYTHWLAEELSHANGHMLYIPDGFAHGFQTLISDSEVLYQMFAFYHAESAHGVRWNDPTFQIQWREDAGDIISDRDRHFPDFIRE